MSDEAIQRYKRELERMGVDPREVARGLLGGRAFVVTRFSVDGVDTVRVFLDEARAVECAEYLASAAEYGGLSWGGGVRVEEHELDFFELVRAHPEGVPVLPSAKRRVVKRIEAPEEGDVGPECRACGAAVDFEGFLCAECEWKVERDEGREKSEGRG